MTLPEAVGELVLRGRVMPASNATFICQLGELQVVYKPVRGEQPLWDFPDGTLAEREYAAYLVSEALGWDVVPPTVLRDGPHGVGMVQEWKEPDPALAPVDIVARGELPEGFLHVFDAEDGAGRPVALVHEESEPLRRMAIFDAVINNGDRKGGHVLAMADGHRYGVDHGVAFHVEPKLRTVLWGWAAEPLRADEIAAVRRLADDGELRERLFELLTVSEVEQFGVRCRELVADGVFPLPDGSWPAIPWPAF
ncbi:SCO1664 family protein [Nocardioides sp. Bht2]|uniref:SCO1664 family protein n=1 Tax=Nocardioides sp. Bht2 TaxID=3392297 RepID=UPI0039B3E2DF